MVIHGLAMLLIFFFFNDTATTEIYTLSLHDALPIWFAVGDTIFFDQTDDTSYLFEGMNPQSYFKRGPQSTDRKSTRLNSSHSQISYAVFCLKKKKTINVKFSSQPDFTELSHPCELST